MDNSDVMAEVYRAIMKALEGKFHMMGSVIDKDARREMLKPNEWGGKYVYDKGDFYSNAGYLVDTQDDGMVLRVGSKVRHEPFVLGGKAPSWTPIAPLKAWVERKNLGWTDKVTGKVLTALQMAYMIAQKIRREGIQERNVYQTVLENREQWIYAQMNSIEVRL